ncbi:MAG: ribosomal protein S18-alanine N-acetyltransferase [Lachnospiraceae bacterium]|nr:ribosomal protein S18-alanine N-acetyltransferase [Lachnospiraceae bacterium]
MKIRRYREKDIKTLAALEKDNFSDPWSEDSLRNSYGTDILVAFDEPDDEDVAGYIIIRTVADESELLRICVSTALRKHGIGWRLISEGINLAKDDGATKMFLEVRSQNSPAIALYRKAGFRDEGLRKNYYSDPQDDAVIMVRSNK